MGTQVFFRPGKAYGGVPEAFTLITLQTLMSFMAICGFMEKFCVQRTNQHTEIRLRVCLRTLYIRENPVGRTVLECHALMTHLVFT